ncbi:MAG: 1,2-phenylacetyl-CoA epoxidase subunit PaaD [Burkholderiaceae bacterium]
MTPVAAAIRVDAAWHALRNVPDPEVPALSVVDLGIVREVSRGDDGVLQVVLTPTYSGCPATEAIEADIRCVLEREGLGPLQISYRLAPAWTSDWISAEGRRKLAEYGIAPPPEPGASVVHLIARNVACPRCRSAHTERLSVFGSTACKSLYRCLACREPFEFFKPI